MKVMLTIQGLYYALTGIWPLLHLQSFEYISGPKTDRWLVKSVAFLVLSSGIIFLYTGLVNPLIPWETVLLAIFNALSLMVIDLHYVRIRRISNIYLLDAAVEFLFLVYYFFNLPA